MQVARLTSKGQVTVPKAVRAALGLERGDLLVFAPQPKGRIELRRLPGQTLSQLYGSLGVRRSRSIHEERKAYRRALARHLKKSRSTA